MLIDQEEEGMVHSEADLRGEGHEAHLGQSSSLCPLFIHSDGPLVLQLGREIRGLPLFLKEFVRVIDCS